MSEISGDRERHCWECRRRCLVCDSAQPACKRCAVSGITCPGYSDVKPTRLRWLAPGRVKSRSKRPKKAVSKAAQNHDEASAVALRLASKIESALIQRSNIRNNFCALGDAVEYYNTCIYYELLPMEQLGQSPFVYPILPEHVQMGMAFPDYLRLSLVCTALSHRMNRTRQNPCHNALTERFYHYRGAVIRSLREDSLEEGNHISDMFLAGVITLLLIDVQQGASPNWRCHLEAIQRLITLRGGIETLVSSKRLDSLLLCFMGVSVLGNTTCPANDIAMTDSHVKELQYMIEQYGNATFGFQMCPPPLFAEIIRINDLRMRTAKAESVQTMHKLSLEACEILGRIEDYSPTQWAHSKPLSTQNWLALGAMYKSATAIYCILSFQSLVLLPLDLAFRKCCFRYSQLLETLLAEAVTTPSTKRFVLWPLIVLGVEAAHGDLSLRMFIGKQLIEMSCYLGSNVPLVAKSVLEKFWVSGETDWDACFDRPYGFATQIAVDMSRISPL